MSTFKVNYAGLRKTQKLNESPSNHSTSAATSNQQTSRTQLPATPTDSQSNSATKQEDNSAFLNLYQGSFQSENLDYINLLLKNKASSSREKNKSGHGEGKKKGHIRTKSTFVDPKQNKLQIESLELSEKAKVEPEYKKAEENDRPASMRPDNDDGFEVREQDKRKGDQLMEREQDEEEFYDGNDTQRNLNNTPTKNDQKLFDRFFKDDGVVRRSMSMEDLRIDKKMFKNNPNKSTLHNPAEMRYYSMEKSPEGSIHYDSKQSNGSFRSDFLTSLTSYLEYFQKSENISYRNMKAGQYFRGNNGKSHRSMQKELEISNQELRALKTQVHDLKWKVNDLTSGSKMLAKELKIANARNEENQQLFQKMQAEILHLKQKNRHYKAQCIQLQEAYKLERAESESNLLALRQVLANSINVALEHKSTPFLGKITDKPVPLNGIGNNITSTKNKDKALKSHMKENRLNGTSEQYASFFDIPTNYKRPRDPRDIKETPKRGGSMIFSPKISITSNEEDSYPDLNSVGYAGSYEGEGSQFQDPYRDAYQEENLKDQQIKFLQDKLAELMINEEVSFNRQQSPRHQKSSTKSSRDKQFHNKKKPNLAITPTNNYYVSRDRQGSLSKLSNLSNKYDPHHRSGLIRHDYDEAPSLNDGTERSFSMHNSD